MDSWFIVWQHKLIVVEKVNGLVTARNFTPTQGRTFFNDNQESQIPFSHGTCRVLASSFIQDFSSGLKIPHLLIVSTSQPASTHITHEILVWSDTSTTTFESCGLQFEIPKDVFAVTEGGTTYHLLDGPTVVWNKKTHVHIVHGKGLCHISVDLHTLAPNLRMKEIRRLWCRMCYKGETLSPSILLCIQLLMQGSVPTREFGDREWLCVEIPLDEGIAGAVRIPDLIPCSYGYIITCMISHKCYCVDQFSGTLVEKVLYLVGTELHQVVIIEGGARKYVLPLDFVPHQVAAMTNTTGNLVVAGRSVSGEACAYELLGDGPNKSGSWSGVRTILTGDFSQIGSNQLLLLKNSGGFILTNFLDVTATDQPTRDEGEDEEDDAHHCPESILNALKGLQLKKHTGEAQLAQYETSQHLKSELLLKSLSFMEGLGRDAPPDCTRSNPGLVCLVPGDVTTCSGDTELGQVRARSPSQVFGVVRLWQRLYNDKWVLGILAKNISKKFVWDVSVSLVILGQPLVEVSSCRTVWNETQSAKCSKLAARLMKMDAEVNAPLKKRRRVVTDRLAAVLTAPHPSDKLEEHGRDTVDPGHSVCLAVSANPCPPGQGAVLVVTWREENMGRRMASEELAEVVIDSDLICHGSGGGYIHQRCLDLWKGDLSMSKDEFTSDEAQSLACILAVHSLTQIHVTSKFTNIWRLPSMIKTRLSLPEHALQVCSLSAQQTNSSPSLSRLGVVCPPGNSSSSTTLPKDVVACGLLGCTAFHIQLEAEAAVISIMHKTGSDIRCVLKLLRDCLPADVSLCLLSEASNSQRDALLCSLSAMGNEAKEKALEMEQMLKLTEEEEDNDTSLKVDCSPQDLLHSLTNASVTKLLF